MQSPLVYRENVYLFCWERENMEQGLTKQQVLAELTKSPHSALNEYIPIFRQSVTQDPEFAAHLIAWDGVNGSIRDAHTALPIISLSVKGFNDPEYLENSLAHLAKLTPRELRASYMFAKGMIRNKDLVDNPSPDPKIVKRWPKVRVGGWKKFGGSLLGPANRMNLLDRLVSRYLHSRESNSAEFERNVLNFREDMGKLYYLTHTTMGDRAKSILMDKIYPPNSSLEAVANLHRMESKEAATAILEHRIPFLSLFPILKSKVKDPVLLMAIIERMSPSEIQGNIAQLEKLGVKDYPETRAALEGALEKLTTSKKNVLRTTKAADKVVDVGLKAKLQAVQEKQIKGAKGIQGNWLVLADCSGSMQVGIETAKLVASTLTKFVKDEVSLVFFNTVPRFFNVTGKTLEEISRLTRGVTAGGGTSIGCGLREAMARKVGIDGIAVISDGEENNVPYFADQYYNLCKETGKEVPVYFYKVGGSRFGSVESFTSTMKSRGYDLQTFNLDQNKVDEYSIANLVPTMSCNRYGLIDAVLDSKLLTIDGVLGVSKKGELVISV